VISCATGIERIGQAAIIEAGAGDDVGDEIDVRCGDADVVERAPQREKIALRNMRQRQILLVPDAAAGRA